MRRLVGVAIAAGLVFGAAVPVAATGPGKNGKLIYTSGGTVYVADANGANPAPVAFGSYLGPIWSSDGLRFVVSVSGDIWSYDATGGDPIQVTSGPASDETPAWSPDGTKVVFGRYLADREAIFVVSATGSGTPKQLSKPTAGYNDFSPAWSPNGQKIAFNRDRNGVQKSYDIWIMKSNGKSPVKWINDTVFNGYPAWSPDSKRLVYEQKVGSKIVLRSRPVSGGSAKTLTTSTAYEPEWSPDGSRIIYQDASGKIKRIPASGGSATTLVGAGYSPSWQPLCNKTAPAGGGTVNGTSRAELLCGGSGPDVVNAGGGDDHVFGFAGADTLNGEAGNDTLVGGPDADTCVQGPGTGISVSC